MAETKAHAAARRARERARKAEYAAESDVDTEDYGYEPVGLSRLAQAIGDCGSELASGSIRIAGGLITDLLATCLSPVDRAFDGRKRYRYREDDDDRDYERDHDASLSRSVGRAADDAADIVGRAHQQFRDTMSGRGYRDTATQDRTVPEDEVPPSKSA